MGVDNAEIVLLNDFRWNPKVISGADFLQVLEGYIVYLPAPKNVCEHDIELKADIPFFATTDTPVLLIKGGSIDRDNTDMNVGWHFIHFWKHLPRSEQKNLTACAHCFAKLNLDKM